MVLIVAILLYQRLGAVSCQGTSFYINLPENTGLYANQVGGKVEFFINEKFKTHKPSPNHACFIKSYNT